MQGIWWPLEMTSKDSLFNPAGPGGDCMEFSPLQVFKESDGSYNKENINSLTLAQIQDKINIGWGRTGNTRKIAALVIVNLTRYRIKSDQLAPANPRAGQIFVNETEVFEN